MREDDFKAISPNFICNHCNNLLHQPVQLDACGHRYCGSCAVSADVMKKHTVHGKTYVRYMCKVEGCPEMVNTKPFEDKCAQRSIGQLLFHCPSMECDWQGKLTSMNEHVKRCQFYPVACVFSNKGCTATPKKKDLSVHLSIECPYRNIQCQHCKSDITAMDSVTHLADECPDVLVSCEACEEYIARKSLPEHSDPITGNCSKLRLPCPFSAIGCSPNGNDDDVLQMDAEQREKHDTENASQHVRLVLKRLTLVEGLVGDIGEEDVNRCGQIANLERTHANTVSKLNQHSDALRALKERCDVFDRALNVCKDRIASKQQEDENPTVSTLSYLVGEATQHVEGVMKTVKETTERLQGLEESNAKLTKKIDNMEHDMGMRDVAIADLEQAIRDLQKVPCHDGELLWKIDDVTKRFENARSGKELYVCSPPFYTSKQGYKMQTRVYLDGDGMGKGTHMSAFLTLLKGDYDALLPWPFVQKVTFILVDHDNINNHVQTFQANGQGTSFRRPRGEINVASGCPTFCPLEKFKNTGFIKDDCMFLKTLVDLTNI